MATLELEARVDNLETILGQFIVSTNVALLRMERGNEAFRQEMKEFKDEMKDFKDEMTEFKDEMKDFKDEMTEFKDEMKDFKDEMTEFKNEMKDFKDEMTDFKDEMKDFKDEMTEFKDEMKDFKDEMTDFKDEMTDFKDETRADRKSMNKKWGDLANKMGTLAEDIVAPNIPRIAREYFQLDSPDFFALRVTKRKAGDRSFQREFDTIAAYPDHLLVNETKSTPKIDYIDAFIETLPQIDEYFPEYRGKTLIPIFSSLHLPDNVLNYLSAHKIYGMAMGDETMILLNADRFPSP
ncbi:hypothetical protein CSB45_12040 [candidate division KSB3 bacterium]|uniref:Uncharacterized protein n=1 Tax=candidate division KSB3 bacterium TaxID=2044937 RepID=A0A2G6E2E8_9BACT|nr:MAG: hypothetical protein CSB45_12040 [candidate division KSB3 bacterium]PIE28828.1 MAG: hypothetical protein CSA57_11715 [candidate division KSB3 bacterium]